MAILGALDRELCNIRSEIRIERKLLKGNSRIWVGSHGSLKILLVQTGVGPDQALQAAQIAITSFPVAVLISVGFASALKGEMKIGDLVVGESAFYLNRNHTNSYRADGLLLLLADQASQEFTKDESRGGYRAVPRASVFKGPILTVRRLVEDAAEKKTLACTTGAIALDMESAAIASAAADAKIASLPVRAISDLVDEDLGGVANFLSPEGALRPFKGVFYLISHPTAFARINRLRTHTAIASKRLGRFIHNYLHCLN
ncbi:MAG: hypothetical protein ACREIQ_07315 [Nitrospiria bacterium]